MECRGRRWARWGAAVVTTVLTLAGAGAAEAQVCSQTAPGVAHIDTEGVPITVKVSAGTPRVNGVSCGFTASAIEITGTAADDAVTLRGVPASVPVAIDLVGGVDTATVWTTTANDAIICGAADVDRDGDGVADLAFGPS